MLFGLFSSTSIDKYIRKPEQVKNKIIRQNDINVLGIMLVKQTKTIY